MGLYYQPKKFGVPALRQLSEAGSDKERIALLTAAVEQLTQALNVELPRVAEAANAAGGFRGAIRTVEADSLVASTDSFLLGDTSAGAVTVSLPLASEYPGLTIGFKRSAGASTFAVAPRGSDTIAGSGSALTVTTTVYLQANSVTSDWVNVT